MARTAPANVREIFDTDLTDASLNAFISAASKRVDSVEAADDGDLDAEELELIERFLAAHMATARDPEVTKEKGASFSADFLRETTFGQTALDLDTTGVLSEPGTDAPGMTLFAPDAKGTRTR